MQYSLYMSLICTMQNGQCLPGLFLLNERHQAVESASHVHRPSVDCDRMYVSLGWIAAEKKLGKFDCDRCDA